MKARLCIILALCMLWATVPLPAFADRTLALQAQSDACEPGQQVTLSLSLPDVTLAGGFVCVQYDPTLLTLTNVSLLQATDALTLTYEDHGGSINVLLDSEQNVQIHGAFLSLIFETNEEIQPGSYPVTCTVPDAASFYALNEDGSTYALHVGGCDAGITITAPILPECPARYLACQETNPSDGSFKLRFCALVASDAALSRGSYGFTCTVTDKDGTRELTLGGSELTDQIEGGGLIYTADQLGGQIYTAALTLPASGEVRISITPYVRLDGQTLYGGTYTPIYLDGAYVKTEY